MNLLRKLSIIFTLATFSISNAYAINYTDEAFAYSDKHKWCEAIRSAKKASDPVVLKTIQSMKFLDSNCNDNSFEEIINFVNQNPKWPQRQKMIIAAENLLNSNSNKNKIIEWFSKNPSITDNGAQHYALAAAEKEKDPAKLTHAIKEGWMYGDYNPSEQKAYLNKYKKYLSHSDHVKKIDYLLWEHKAEKANSLMHLVDKSHQTMFKAAVALIQNKKGAESLFLNLPEENKYNSIVLYSYLKRYEKQDINSNLGRLISKAHSDSDHASQWWMLKSRFARDLMKQKKYHDAYNIVSNHHATSSEDISNAEFLSGFLALRYLNKPSEAKKHFLAMHKIVKMPISIAKASYWIARCDLATGNDADAHKHLREAAAFNYTFYGQLAELELGNKSINLPSRPKINDTHKHNVNKNELARASKILLAHGKDMMALLYAKDAMAHTSCPAEALLLVDYMRATGKPRYTAELAKAAGYHKIFLRHDAFPTPYKAPKGLADPAFVYSIIRQETLFDPNAVSNRDARGLMQLIPATACQVSKKLNIKCRVGSLLKDPEYNIKLGSKYLKDLLDKYNGSYILAVSEYNAGPNPTARWIDTYGDPRKLTKLYDVIDWMENIPYHETRNYAQRILENLQIYRAILGGGENMRILQDMGVKDIGRKIKAKSCPETKVQEKIKTKK